MLRNTKARLKKLALLPNHKVNAPSSPDEAKKWLGEVARYLYAVPNASNALKFVACGIRIYLSGKRSLNDALRLDLHTDSKPGRGRPQVPLATVQGIAKMLAEGVDIATIRKTFPISKTTADRIRADYRALTLTITDSHRMEDGHVRDREWKAAIRRARGIRPEWRESIILGMADTMLLDDLVDPIDPANPFAPQQVDPRHKPDLVRSRLK